MVLVTCMSCSVGNLYLYFVSLHNLWGLGTRFTSKLLGFWILVRPKADESASGFLENRLASEIQVPSWPLVERGSSARVVN